MKLHGFRIELGEIEARLGAQSGVEKACIKVVGDKLVGYVIGSVDKKAILSELAKQMPHYMVPAAIISLDEFPLTPNGKLDLKALPDLNFVAEEEDEFVEAINERELQIRKIIATALNRQENEISANISFLRIGGDSISAMRVSSLCKRRVSRSL